MVHFIRFGKRDRRNGLGLFAQGMPPPSRTTFAKWRLMGLQHAVAPAAYRSRAMLSMKSVKVASSSKLAKQELDRPNPVTHVRMGNAFIKRPPGAMTGAG